MITRLLSEENIYAFGWTVLHSLWQAFLVALIMGVILLFMQKRRAQIRYWLANGALLTVFLLSVVTFISLGNGTVAMGEAEMILLIDASSASKAEGTSILSEWWSRFLQYFNTHLPMVVSIWLVGMAFFILRMLGSLAYVERLRHDGQVLAEYWQKRLEVIKSSLQVSRPVQLLESVLVKTPMVIGVLKPVILLPLGAVNGLSPAEVEAVLAHELAHIRRSDYLFNIIQSILEVLYYFNPAVWWISANIRLERENCCDDLAVAFCGNSLIYAKALVKVEELSRRAPAFAMAFSTGKNQMLNRVKRILNQSENRSNIMEKLTATLLLVLAVALFSISANQPLDEQREMLELEPLADAQNLVLQSVEEAAELNPLAERVWVEEPFGKIADLPKRKIELLLNRDTLPAGKTTLNLTRLNGQKVEAKIKDGKITYLKIDGKEIPDSEYSKYESMLEDILEDEIPMPPPPPKVPVPPAPPAPGTAPAPPTAPSAPTAPNLFFRDSKKITTEKDKDGNTVITIESVGDEPMSFTIDDMDNTIFFDGELLEEGENMIIQEEHSLFDDPKSNAFFFQGPETEVLLEKMHSEELELNEVEVEKLREMADSQRAMLSELREKEQALHKANEKERREKMTDLREKEREMRSHLDKELHSMDREVSIKMERELKVIEREQALRGAKMERELRDQERELARELRREYQSGYRDGKVHKRLEKEMLEDGFIKSGKSYNFELSSKDLKINGKKQSDALHKKYLEIYQEVTGRAIDGKSKLIIDKNE